MKRNKLKVKPKSPPPAFVHPPRAFYVHSWVKPVGLSEEIVAYRPTEEEEIQALRSALKEKKLLHRCFYCDVPFVPNSVLYRIEKTPTEMRIDRIAKSRPDPEGFLSAYQGLASPRRLVTVVL